MSPMSLVVFRRWWWVRRCQAAGRAMSPVRRCRVWCLPVLCRWWCSGLRRGVLWWLMW